MTEERDTPDDLFPFAQVLVKQLKAQHQLRWSKHKMEDAEQDLFLAGWQVWQDEQNVGLAKNRMRDRAKNLLRDFQAELEHEPKTGFSPPRDKTSASGALWNEDAIRAWDSPDVRASIRDDPAEVASVNSYLEGLTDRQRQIVLMRMAGCTTQETADHPISTGPLEAVNNKIKLLNRQAFGYRNPDFFLLKLFALHNARYAFLG